MTNVFERSNPRRTVHEILERGPIIASDACDGLHVAYDLDDGTLCLWRRAEQPGIYVIDTDAVVSVRARHVKALREAANLILQGVIDAEA